MEKLPPDEPQKLRQLAKELRETARTAELPCYAEQSIHAADDLEKHAAKMEALR